MARIQGVPREEIRDPELQGVLERAERLSTPKPAWYLMLAHNPEMAKAYARYWDATHRGGTVEHTTKELMRIHVSQLLGCSFCSAQRSVKALEEGLTEEDVDQCTLTTDHPNPRVRAALRYVEALTVDASAETFDDVYRELREVYSEAEIVELGCFAAIAIGGVKLSRSLDV